MAMNNSMGAGEMLAPGSQDGGMDEKSDQSSKENPIMLSADMLGGMKAKDGDKLTFCVTADPDSEGNVMGYFEPANEAEDESEDWDEALRQEMSPRNAQETPQ